MFGMSGFLTDRAVDVGALLAEVQRPECGATALFLGTVRAGAEDGDVRGIEYSAYPEMAEAELGRIVAGALERWPTARIALRHRTGYIPLGEASIAVAAAAPHRSEAFEACRYVIEEVKHRAPIWKRETLGSGETRWVGRCEPPAAPEGEVAGHGGPAHA